MQRSAVPSSNTPAQGGDTTSRTPVQRAPRDSGKGQAPVPDNARPPGAPAQDGGTTSRTPVQ
ncbi:hypothetical protein, partial [Streptomyces mayonensis]|uniref:hypothetical protein n=1 Tax=Streptomyces mayonensis TaxID=2750816 RepID=UPI001C1E2C64